MSKEQFMQEIRTRFEKRLPLVRPGTLSEYEWCLYQQTVLHVDDLTDEGMELYQLVEQAVNLGYGQQFGRGELVGEDSGFWSADRESPFYCPAQGAGYFTSKNNRLLVASEPDPGFTNKFKQTSLVIFFGKNWVYTMSGSLYVYSST